MTVKIKSRIHHLPLQDVPVFPRGACGKKPTCQCRLDLRHAGLFLGSRRSSGGGHSDPLQYSCLENSHGQRSLAGYSLWSCKESDVTEQLSTQVWPEPRALEGLGDGQGETHGISPELCTHPVLTGVHHPPVLHPGAFFQPIFEPFPSLSFKKCI